MPGDPVLVAVVEMVGPANKDRPSERRAFAGSILPTLPLWLDEEGSVPVDLEVSYLAACQALRIQA